MICGTKNRELSLFTIVRQGDIIYENKGVEHQTYGGIFYEEISC